MLRDQDPDIYFEHRLQQLECQGISGDEAYEIALGDRLQLIEQQEHEAEIRRVEAEREVREKEEERRQEEIERIRHYSLQRVAAAAALQPFCAVTDCWARARIQAPFPFHCDEHAEIALGKRFPRETQKLFDALEQVKRIRANEDLNSSSPLA